MSTILSSLIEQARVASTRSKPSRFTCTDNCGGKLTNYSRFTRGANKRVYSVSSRVKRQVSIILSSLIGRASVESIRRKPSRSHSTELDLRVSSIVPVLPTIELRKPRYPWYFQQVASLDTPLRYCAVVFHVQKDVTSWLLITTAARCMPVRQVCGRGTWASRLGARTLRGN